MMDGIVDFQDICTQDWLTEMKPTKNSILSWLRKYQYAGKHMVRYWLEKEVSDISTNADKIQTDFTTYSEAQSFSN